MNDAESNTLTEKDIIEVAERKDRADDPMHADWEFRDEHDGTDLLTDVQRLWLHHPAFPSPSERRARARPQDGCAISIHLELMLVLSGHGNCRVRESPDNAVNTELPGNVLPEEAREIIRFQAKVEALAALIAAGKTPQTEGIELVFNCRRSGRADSPYAKARAAVQAQIGPARAELVGEMIERVQREVAAEH